LVVIGPVPYHLLCLILAKLLDVFSPIWKIKAKLQLGFGGIASSTATRASSIRS